MCSTWSIIQQLHDYPCMIHYISPTMRSFSGKHLHGTQGGVFLLTSSLKIAFMAIRISHCAHTFICLLLIQTCSLRCVLHCPLFMLGITRCLCCDICRLRWDLLQWNTRLRLCVPKITQKLHTFDRLIKLTEVCNFLSPFLTGCVIFITQWKTSLINCTQAGAAILVVWRNLQKCVIEITRRFLMFRWGTDRRKISPKNIDFGVVGSANSSTRWPFQI